MLLAELGVENEIDFRPTDKFDDPRYCSSDCLIVELESLPGNKHHNALHCNFYSDSMKLHACCKSLQLVQNIKFNVIKLDF